MRDDVITDFGPPLIEGDQSVKDDAYTMNRLPPIRPYELPVLVMRPDGTIGHASDQDVFPIAVNAGPVVATTSAPQVAPASSVSPVVLIILAALAFIVLKK